VWDILGEAGKTSVLVGVPQTYPVRPLNGHMISCFLTPGTESAFTYPAMLKTEVLRLSPHYPFDVREFRTPDKPKLLQQIIDLTEQQFRVALHLLKTKPWDYFHWVNMGTDRIHHGFWRFHDPLHRLHEPGNPFQHAIRDYYKLLDTFVAQLIQAAGDDVTVLVVSDHGVSRMDGGICINEWLWRNGWLTLRTPPPEGRITRFEDADIDWSRTRAWASGGYYGRVFLNIQGREPQGVIAPEAARVARDELAVALAAIPDPDGNPLHTQVFKPFEIYQAVNNIAPDLMVYFGNLNWRAVGSLGHGAHFTYENDTGPDDANHAQHGMFILHEPGARARGRVDGHQLMDIAPTLLARMGVRPPLDMQGRVMGG
jgi:predicted AlkP superfamily phosphohydrolase/phosphomutase